MKKVRVILVDDHTVVRKGLKSSIVNNSVEIVHDVSSGEEALDFLAKNEIEMVITDISMSGISGLELCKTIRASYPQTKVLILSMHKDKDYVVNAFKAGAMGYLTKDADESEFYAAIEMISSGKKFLSPFVSEILASQLLNDDPDTQPEKLTSREIEILTKIVSGLSNKQIADDLFISARTVDTHRTNMMRKLGAKNAAELVRIALTNKLVRESPQST